MFQAIHDGQPDQSLLAYQYLQMMPKIADGDANKVWIIPSEFGKALEGLGSTLTELPGIPQEADGPRVRVDMGPTEPELPHGSGVDSELSSTHADVEAAIAEAQNAAVGSKPVPGATTPTQGPASVLPAEDDEAPDSPPTAPPPAP